MSQLGTVYATKRRRRNGKTLKPPTKDAATKSNPSKRHRERLNAELDLLASLLPFEQNILSKLDRLSILRLSVSYLRTKSYFQVVMRKEKEDNGILAHIHTHDGYRTRETGALENNLLDGDMFLQALNGFLMILTCEGEVFFATHSIESYLGFHQSDIVHQSVYELVHSEDREELQRQLIWNSFFPQDLTGMSLSDALEPDKTIFFERSFTVRFRCLLDNTSGFLRLDIRGRVKILHGQNRKTEDPPLALFCYCTPFGPPSLLEIPQKENMFKSKHKLDLTLVSMDQRGKHILGYSDSELVNLGGYDLVHFDDLAYVASAHQEMLKTGASGMIAYRYQKKDGAWQWLQTSSRLVYKNSKPDFVICTHRQLMEEEGRDLLGKRTMDFKVSYLDTGLSSTYYTDTEQLITSPSCSPNAIASIQPPQPRSNRRYKTQLRDFLSSCRPKRKSNQNARQMTPPTPTVDYISDPSAVAVAYSNLNPMYTSSPYTPSPENLYMSPTVHSKNFYPVSENIFHQYRFQGVGSYFPDFHHSSASATSFVANSFIPYESPYIVNSNTKDSKWPHNPDYKYYQSESRGRSNTDFINSNPSPTNQLNQSGLKAAVKTASPAAEVISTSSREASPKAPVSACITVPNCVSNTTIGNITPKRERSPPPPSSPFEPNRQTVLMWGTNHEKYLPTRSPAGLTSNEVFSAGENGSPKMEHLQSNLKWNCITKDFSQVYPISSNSEDHSTIYSFPHSGNPLMPGEHQHSQTSANHSQSHMENNCEAPFGRHHNTVTLSLAQQRLYHGGSSSSSSNSSPKRQHYLAYTPSTVGDQPDGSPLLSFSEVTNTLLNQ